MKFTLPLLGLLTAGVSSLALPATPHKTLSSHPSNTRFSNMTIVQMVSREDEYIITQKKLKYIRFADTQQFDKMNQVILPDAKFTFVDEQDKIVDENGVHYAFDGLDAFNAFFSQVYVVMQAVHIVGPPELLPVSDTEIQAIFPLTYHLGPRATPSEGQGTGGGAYYETWVKKDGDWFMKTMKMQRLYWRP